MTLKEQIKEKWQELYRIVDNIDKYRGQQADIDAQICNFQYLKQEMEELLSKIPEETPEPTLTRPDVTVISHEKADEILKKVLYGTE